MSTLRSSAQMMPRSGSGSFIAYVTRLTAIVMLAHGVVPTVIMSQRPAPTRSLVIVGSTDSGVVSSVQSIHARSNGSVLFLDPAAKRLVLLDATLKKLTVLADTGGQGKAPFGDGLGGLLPFAGDSDAFVDESAKALIVVGPGGEFGRATTPPLGSEMDYFRTYFTRVAVGQPAFDTRGRLYFRGRARDPVLVGAPAADTSYVSVDSAPIVRADFESRRLDTVAMMRIPTTKMKFVRNGAATRSFTILNPLRQTDDWVVFGDGTVAVVRSHDYHIDWYNADGSHTSSAKLPFDWRALTDSDKRRMIDSAQRILDSVAAASAARAAAQRAAASGPPAVGRPPAGFSVVAQELLHPDELPDYYPPLSSVSQTRIDPSGNIWILPMTSARAGDGLVFDVVNKKGELVQRVQLPPGRNLQGFGSGGAVYLSVPQTSRTGAPWPRLELARFADQRLP